MQIFKTSFDTHYKILETEKSSGLFLNQIRNQILLDNKEFSIENVSKFSQSEKYKIRDSDSKQIIAEIIINGWGANPFWQDSPSAANAQIIINKKVFNFRNITTWQALTLFNRNRNKSYNFKLYCVHGNEYLDYQITLQIPIFRSINYFTSTSFTGGLENKTSSNLFPLIGLFLIQKSFENEGQDYSG